MHLHIYRTCITQNVNETQHLMSILNTHFTAEHFYVAWMWWKCPRFVTDRPALMVEGPENISRRQHNSALLLNVTHAQQSSSCPSPSTEA